MSGKDEHIEAVQRMQDYIVANLDGHISMADLAGASNYSPWYSYRFIFSNRTESNIQKQGMVRK